MHGMQELFERAKRNGLWFHCAYQDLWFSPEELARHQADGRFRWGPVNWTLRNPDEHVSALRAQARERDREADRVGKRIDEGKAQNAEATSHG